MIRPCYLQVLLRNGASLCSVLSRETREMWKNRWIFFYLSLSGFKVRAQPNSVQIDQLWSKTLFVGRNAAHFSVFPQEKTIFGGFFFTRIVKWNNTFILWLNKSLCCNLTQTMSFKSQPCSPAGWKLLFLSSPHAFVPCLAPVSHEHPQTPAPAPSFRGAAGGGADALAQTKAGHHTWRAAETTLPWGRRLWPLKTNIPKCLARLFFCWRGVKILLLPLEVVPGL